MQEFIEKLIGRLEEEQKKQQYLFNNVLNNDNQRMVHAYAEQCYLYMTEIVNQLAEEHNNDFCEWKFTKSVADGGYFYSSGCNHKRFSDLHSFEFCPYCGKKIKVAPYQPEGD